MNAAFDDPHIHLNLLWHAMAERLEAQIEKLDHVHVMLANDKIFAPSVLLGPLINPREPGPAWKLSDVVAQTAVSIPQGLGAVVWTRREFTGLRTDHPLMRAIARGRFRHFRDCHFAIKVRYWQHFPALEAAMQKRLRDVMETGQLGFPL